MTVEIPDLTSDLGYWLRLVSDHVLRSFDKKLSIKGMTVAEYMLVCALSDCKGVSIADLATEMGMSRRATNRIAGKLIERALVRKDRNPDDGRSKILALAESSLMSVRQLALLAEENDAECFHHLSRMDCIALRRILRETLARWETVSGL